LKGNAFGVKKNPLPVYVKKATDYNVMKARDVQAAVVKNKSKTYLFEKSCFTSSGTNS